MMTATGAVEGYRSAEMINNFDIAEDIAVGIESRRHPLGSHKHKSSEKMLFYLISWN